MTDSLTPSQLLPEDTATPAIQPVTEPTRGDIDAMPGLVLLEFGAGWCGYCKAAQPLIMEALNKNAQTQHGKLMHIKIEDGKGKRLGRSFSIKLWPTLVALLNGVEVGRVVRPQDAREILDILPPA